VKGEIKMSEIQTVEVFRVKGVTRNFKTKAEAEAYLAKHKQELKQKALYAAVNRIMDLYPSDSDDYTRYSVRQIVDKLEKLSDFYLEQAGEL
jgi:hypothetical protein